MNNRFMKSYERMDGAFSATVVVDSLPTSPQPNVIYAVKKLDYYTSFYGLRIPPLTSIEDVSTSVLATLMQQNGWSNSEITQELFGFIVGLGMLPSDLTLNWGTDPGNETVSNLYNNKFELKAVITSMSVNVDKSFEKLDDLYQYLFSEEHAQSFGILTNSFEETQAKLREHNFVWSEQALPDYQLGVVFTPTYEYYIYNGEEWKNVDDQIVVKPVDSLNEGIKFTEEETLKLAQGAKLYALVATFFGNTLIDCIEIGRFSAIQNGKAVIDAYYKIGLAFEPDGTTYKEYLINIYTNDLDPNNPTTGKIYCQLGTRVRFSGSLTTEGWVEVTDVPGYKYGYFVGRWGVTQSSIVDVYFSTSDAASGNFAPFVNTNPDSSISLGGYGFVIYAKEKPTAIMSFSYDVEF